MEKKIYEGRDSFSDLADHVLDRIITFLPTKDAVRAMLVSKRFKESWTHVRAFDFEEGNYLEEKRVGVFEGKKFRNFVSQVVKLNKSPQIDVFRLKCYFSEIIHDKIVKEVGSWLDYLLTRKKLRICELEFGKAITDSSILGTVPNCTFNNACLEEIRLTRCIIELEGPIRMALLKKFSLKNVWVENEDMNCIIRCSPMLQELSLTQCGKLTSLELACPSFKGMLQELSIVDCKRLTSLKCIDFNVRKLVLSGLAISNDSLNNFLNHCPSLQELRIANCRRLRCFNLSDTSGVKELSLDLVRVGSAPHIVSGPKLRSLYVESLFPVEISNIDAVTDASIFIQCTDLLSFKTLIELTQNIAKVTVHYSWLTAMLQSNFEKCFPSLQNSWKYICISGEQDEIHLPSIHCLLRNSPCLEELVIDCTYRCYPTVELDDLPSEDGGEYGFSEGCDSISLRKHLKKVVLRQCSFYSLVEIASFFLKNALVLEELVIEHPKNMSIAFEFTVINCKRKLQASPKASRFAKIIFCGQDLL